MDRWECATCGRANAARHRVCLLCGSARGAGPEPTPGELLERASAELSARYRQTVRIGIIGAGRALTREDAEQLIQETAASLAAEHVEHAEGPVRAAPLRPGSPRASREAGNG